jgi:hypothetical protein
MISPIVLGESLALDMIYAGYSYQGWKVMYASVQNYAALAALRRQLALVGAQEPAPVLTGALPLLN